MTNRNSRFCLAAHQRQEFSRHFFVSLAPLCAHSFSRYPLPATRRSLLLCHSICCPWFCPLLPCSLAKQSTRSQVCLARSRFVLPFWVNLCWSTALRGWWETNHNQVSGPVRPFVAPKLLHSCLQTRSNLLISLFWWAILRGYQMRWIATNLVGGSPKGNYP
jgi:hypothetical protein